MTRRPSAPFAIAALLLGTLPGHAAAAPVDFNREVRPILSDNCFQCHGPDDKHRMAGLRLDIKDGAFATTKRGAVVVPGHADQSLLFQRVHHADLAKRMPPASSERKLSDAQIDTLRRWIDEGASWQTHWAFTAPQRSALPAVQNASWARNDIDRFILARLEKENLKPSPEADRVTLLRRLSFDLTGLPPTPAEVDQFLRDKSPNAYEAQVDRLLASPHYGERMAMQWMDLARYADSHGYHIDSHRDMWPWRDWVIRAFNTNLPFDQFAVKQLAGDLLPNATTDDRIATGFNRNHMINFEGGAIPDEYLVEYVADRAETTSTAFMGLTMGCARCHSHKYDPISHKEFYQFFAFFNSVNEKGLDGRDGNARPFLPLPTQVQATREKELAEALKSTEAAVNAKEVTAAQQQWHASLAGHAAGDNHDALVAQYDFDGSLADSAGQHHDGRTLAGDPTFGAGQLARAVGFDGQTQVTLGNLPAFTGPQTLALWLKYGGSKQPMPVFEQIEDAASRRGWELWFEDIELVAIQRRAARLVLRVSNQWPQDALVLRTKTRLPQGDWRHVALVSDGGHSANSTKLYIDGQPQEMEVVRDGLSALPKARGEWMIGAKEPDAKVFAGNLDDLRLYSRALSPTELTDLAINYPARAILSGVGGKVTKPEEERLRDYYLTYVAPENIRQQYADVKRLRRESSELQKQILTTMVMEEDPKPRESHILLRGDYRNLGDLVTPGVPAVLPPLPKAEGGAPPNRLTLARWLVDPQHPLTARVAVNRYWQLYFGNGLVKTSENFGSQGDPPSHPELLDWLATEFIRTGWDVKAMQRLIVTSAVYRQGSQVSPELLERDPENRLLARGPRFRLPAEMIRDNALMVSGLLNQATGGPSVLPYQPAGLWEELAFGDGFSRQTYEQSHGPDLYRRSMYTFAKRTVPPAQMLTFDAPDREKCTARRTITNTPLQALILLNDPTYLEAARALAQRVLSEGSRDPGKRAAEAFRLVTARPAKPEEVKILTQLAANQLRHYQQNPAAAAALLKNGESPVNAKLAPAELAAWTMVSSAILNLDETVTKE